MCGITGFYGFEDKVILKKMTDIISHRGPDDYGYYSDSLISLGHRRLSIIDLSEKGRQPMHNEDESIWLVFNGEIYNFKELRVLLEKNRHEFYSNTDTECIIHAYEEYGEEFVKYLDGIFAFALWDSNIKKLILARDRFGEKPLYYSISDGKLIFSSELKSIMLYPEINKVLNRQAIAEFLDLRYIPGPKTIFSNIFKLQSAHMLLWQNNKADIKRFWELKMNPENLSEEYLVKNMRREIGESVKRRLVSEVPLGAFLSGGIDSSTVVAYMAGQSNETVKTYAVTFGHEKQKNEMNYARLVAEHFRTDHKEICVDVDTVGLLPEIVWHLDEPMSDATVIPTYLLSKSIKKYATVVLTGDGGDELFAGYEQEKLMMLFDKVGKCFPRIVTRHAIPLGIKCIPKRVLDIFFKYTSSLGVEGQKRFSRIMHDLGDMESNYSDLISIFSEEEKKELLVNPGDYEMEHVAKSMRGYIPNRKELLNGLLKYEIDTVLPDDMLMKVDKMSSAHAVEVRTPFLDHKLAEFSGKISPDLKLRGITEKFILKKAMQGILPKEIIKRKKERFFVPIDEWLGGQLKPIVESLLSESTLKKEGYFQHDYIKKTLEKYDSSKLYYGRQLWNIITFEIWHRMLMENNLSKPIKLDELI